MAKKWALSEETQQKIHDAREALDLEIQELQTAYDAMGDSWQDSDQGQNVSVFLEDLTSVFDAMDVTTEA